MLGYGLSVLCCAGKVRDGMQVEMGHREVG